jgi:hypothetical protein
MVSLRNTAIVAAEAKTVRPEFPDVAAGANQWKTRVHTALATVAGDRGSLTLFGKRGG